jgi:hypothetical protein
MDTSNNAAPTDASVSLEKISEEQQVQLSNLSRTLREKFEKAKTNRQTHENRWIKSHYNYRGEYTNAVQFTETEKSRAFVKITKTKVLAAYGQIVEVLFANGKFPLTVDQTVLPEGIKDAVHVDTKNPKGPAEPELDETSPDAVAAVGFPGDGNDLKPGETLKDRVGAYLADKLKNVTVKDGEGAAPTDITFHPAHLAAKRMEKKIHDQLDETGATTHLRRAAFEMALFGTGIIKGPFHESKEYPKWDEAGVYKPIMKTVPKLEHYSIWNFYPDPECTSMLDCDWAFQRHKLSRAAVRALKKRPHFDENQIETAISAGPNYQREWWEPQVDDRNSTDNNPDRWEVLEYWGNADTAMLIEHGLELPAEIQDQKEVQVNIWMIGNLVVRIVVNPFKPQRIPFHVSPYEISAYSIWGVGVAENMEDSQMLMNGFVRLAVDNAVLAGNIMLEVDETNLAPGQDMKTYPGKVWRRQGGPPGQAIYAVKWPNTIQENMGMFDKFRQLADESTGMPSYSHGQTGIASTGRTAAGMSMLMGAAALSIKTVVKNVDDYWLQPIGEALFAFNMQFDFDPTIKGDLAVKARGTSSLMQREVRSQRLLTFLQVVQNPTLAPFAKIPTILRAIAESMDLDPDKSVNNMEEAKLQALVLGNMNQTMNPQQQEGAPPGANPMDPTGVGGGNIAPGAAPQPQEPGFAANTGAAPAPAPEPAI